MGSKVHIQRFISNLLELKPFIPVAIANIAKIHLNRWFPSVFSAVCQQNDLLCIETKGLLKLADIREPGFINAFAELFPHMVKAIRNKAKDQASQWLPSLISPVCHQSDFLCKKTAGLLQIEDILPEFMMKGIEYCAENPLFTSGIAGGVSLICYGLYRSYNSLSLKNNQIVTANQHRQLLTQ